MMSDIVGAGSVLCMLPVIDNIPALTTITAETIVNAFVLPKSKLLQLILDYPEARLEEELCRLGGVLVAELYLHEFNHLPHSKVRKKNDRDNYENYNIYNNIYIIYIYIYILID